MENPVSKESTSLIVRIADKFGVDPTKMMGTLKATAFRQRDNSDITNEQMMALLIVADQFGLNPFTRELFAYNDRGAVVPVVSVDGWVRLINSHRDYDGVEFRYSDDERKLENGKNCPEWCEVSIYRKSLGRPITISEYLDEVYVQSRGGKPTPWQSHPRRMLRWKTLIQGARVAFGFAGIYDEDEANRIIDGEHSRVASTTAGGANAKQLQDALEQRSQPQVIEHEGNVLDVVTDLREREPVVAEARQTDAALVYDSEGPGGLSAMIATMDMDDATALEEVLDLIALIVDETERKQLTREALTRKAAHISGKN